MIKVTKKNENTFDVTVKDETTTSHEVTVSEYYYNRLTNGDVSKEILIEQSFLFLLERESNTMIFPKFDLPIIQTYFSNYEENIKIRLKT